MVCDAWQRDQREPWSAAASCRTPEQGMPGISLTGAHSPDAAVGDLCVFVWYCFIPVLQGSLLVTSESPEALFYSFLYIWLLDLCEDIDCPWCAGDWAEAEGRVTGGEKHWCFAGFNLSDFCFSCPAHILRVKLIPKSGWVWIFPLRLFVRGFLCPPPLSIQEVISEALFAGPLAPAFALSCPFLRHKLQLSVSCDRSHICSGALWHSAGHGSMWGQRAGDLSEMRKCCVCSGWQCDPSGPLRPPAQRLGAALGTWKD